MSIKQQDYETIIDCINHGAPALAPKLITALNQLVENNNLFLEEKRKAYELEQAEIANAKKAKDAAKLEALGKGEKK